MPPLTTYEGAALTCQPLPLSSPNPFLKHIPLNIEWFSSRADIQKLYLTVMQAPQNRGWDFYFKYQTAELDRTDITRFYEVLSEILTLGTQHETLRTREFMEQLARL